MRPLVLTLLALLAGGGSLPVRAAGPADDAGHPANGWSEEWRVIAFDRATHGSVAISLVARPIPWLEVQVRQGAKTWAADAELPNGLLDHRGPGVTIANLPDNAPPQTNSLSYSRGKYVVDLTWPARGRVTVTPVRRGVVVGPWRLGKERVLPAKPPAFVPGTMIWSVPVALGTASGSIEAYGHRIAFHGWQAYHDRTWGRFRLSSTSWAHWDFAVVSPRRGETWILNGLEPTEGGWRSYEKTSAASAGATCCPRRCGRAAEVTRWRSSRSTAAGRSSGCSPAGLRASSPLARGNGWVEHGTPPIPTS